MFSKKRIAINFLLLPLMLPIQLIVWAGWGAEKVGYWIQGRLPR